MITPAFDGKTHVEYTISFSSTILHLESIGIKTDFFISTSGSLLCAERNRLLKRFLESDASHVLCIDSDLGWSPISVEKILEHDMDFIGGLYPSRKDKSFMYRPSKQENGALIVHPSKGLIKMECIPAGFMLIKRHVIEKMMKDNPQDHFVPKDGSPDGYALFNTEMYEGEFWGEDYIFCNKARASGFDIWIDPLIQFSHAGIIGMFAETLKKEPH